MDAGKNENKNRLANDINAKQSERNPTGHFLKCLTGLSPISLGAYNHWTICLGQSQFTSANLM